MTAMAGSGDEIVRLIDIRKPTQKTMEALTNLDLPAGVEIEIKL